MIKKLLKKFAIKTTKNIKFWLEAARFYSTPITVLTWLCAFIYSLKSGGKFIPGIIALLGICLVHLATNLIDDYFDYKILSKDESFMKSAQDCKCSYLRSGKVSTWDLLIAIAVFLFLAGIIGLILLILSGKGVIWLTIVALCVAFGYQRLSLIGLGEIAIIIAYGPLLFEGVYYVMTKTFSWEILLPAFACVMFVNTILYAHMLMDYDGDKCSHKKTICLYLQSKTKALNFLLLFYLASYILIGVWAAVSHNKFLYATYITIPMVLELYKHLDNYNADKTKLPRVMFWHYPLDNWNKIKGTSNAPFYFRFFYARNILTIFLLLVCAAIIVG